MKYNEFEKVLFLAMLTLTSLTLWLFFFTSYEIGSRVIDIPKSNQISMANKS